MEEVDGDTKGVDQESGTASPFPRVLFSPKGKKVRSGRLGVEGELANGVPGVLFFPGRCPQCQFALGKIHRSTAAPVAFRRGPRKIALEVGLRYLRDEVASSLAHYVSVLDSMSEGDIPEIQQRLTAAVEARDFEAIRRLSERLTSPDLVDFAARKQAVQQEVNRLELALQQRGDLVTVPRFVVREEPTATDKEYQVPSDCIQEVIQAWDCSCGTANRLPTAYELLEVPVGEGYPSWPTSLSIYGGGFVPQVLPTGRYLPAHAVNPESVRDVLRVQALEQEGQIEKASEGLQGIDPDLWQVVAGKKLKLNPWMKISAEARSYLTQLSGGEGITGSDLPKDVSQLLFELTAIRDQPPAAQEDYVNTFLRDLSFPGQEIRKQADEALRLKLNLSRDAKYPTWVLDYLRQFRNPSLAINNIVNGIVTQQNYRDHLPSPGEKLRSLMGRVTIPSAQLPHANRIWSKMGGKGLPPKNFLEFFNSNPSEVEEAVNQRFVTARNFRSLGREWKGFSAMVQAFSGLKDSCSGLDPRVQSQHPLFKVRQADGTLSPSLKGWVKDFLTSGKIPRQEKLARLLRGEVTETNYKSLFQKARGGSAPPANRPQPKKAQRETGDSGAGLQPPRASSKGRPARSYADAVQAVDRPTEKGRSGSNNNDPNSRILDLLTALDRRIQSIESRGVSVPAQLSPRILYERDPVSGALVQIR